MYSYLITGGSGFIGTNLINELLGKYGDIKIVNIDINPSEIIDSRLTTIIVDIRNEINIQLEMQFDVCVHLAALCKEPGYQWNEYFETNYSGTENVLRLCSRLGVKKIIFTSTMMVYKAAELQRDESSLTAPDTAYGMSKLLAEKNILLWELGENGRLVYIIRPAVVFGRNENANFTRLIKGLKAGIFPFVGRQTTIKSNIYVKELINFMLFLLKEHPKYTLYNMAFPEASTIRSITDSIINVFHIKAIRPVIPFSLMITISYVGLFLSRLGIRTTMHPRRVEKLYYSTHIYPKNAIESGYNFDYTTRTALEDWKHSNDENI